METLDHLKKMLERERLAKCICAELNNFVNLRESMLCIAKNIQALSNCEAVGIRLQECEDFPYYVYHGFSQEFIEKENSLFSCLFSDTSDNKSCLECMCGSILTGKYSKDLPFFTAKGSFWTNHFSAIAQDAEKILKKFRNHCGKCGYESVALVPIKFREQKVGLIQLNDKKTECFDLELIEYIEMIGEQLGLAIQNSIIYTKLKKAFEEIHILQGLIPICSKCKKIRDDKGYWHQVESYLEAHSNMQFTHGICAECARQLYPEYFDKKLAKSKAENL
ncbi:MAG: GAF domain-containing protein [Candidatus Brocadiae bacterium]|nr:GAF domain-containing protein [Candidatus Brocadiia bacterium]